MTTPPSNIFVILPAFNESRALRQLIPDLAQALKPLDIPFTLCVVDDGSTDDTAALMRSLGTTLPLQPLRHEKNQGYGAAIRTGALWVIQNAKPEDIAITMDSDNTHSPVYIPLLLKKLQEGFDVVTASYSGPGGAARGVPFQRRLLSRAANGLLRTRFRFPGLGTYTNGYRAYRVGALQQAHYRYRDRLLTGANFSGGTELFINTIRSGARGGEVPFTLDYEKRGADSKINLPRTILGYLRLLLQ